MRPLTRALPLALLLLVLPHARTPVPELEARDWVRPAVSALGLEVAGDPGLWNRQNAKALDPVYDGAAGELARGDLMGFYFDQEVDRLSFRVNLYRAPGTAPTTPLLEPGVRVFVLMDYEDGGTRRLPEGIPGAAPMAWDRAVEITDLDPQLRTRVLDAQGSDRETERVRSAVGSRFYGTAETSIWLPGGFEQAVTRAAKLPTGDYARIAARAAADESTPIAFYVFTTDGSRVLDDLSASNAPVSNTHNVAFMQHLNQGLTYTTVFRGERGEFAANDGDPANPDDGADEILAAHDFYNLPLNWHPGGLLISAAEWHDPGFNDWLAAGVTAGRYEIVTSALGQHMMPFVRDEINGKAVDTENDLINYHYGYTPRVAWVPERVWVENPDDDGNGVASEANVLDYIEDDFTDNGVWAVILDDYIHCGYLDDAFNDRHIYTYGNGIKVLPIDNTFVGDVNYNAGNAWNTILSGTSDEIIIYGNDAEFVAEVSQGAGNASALNNYIWILQQCSANSGTVGVWKLTDVLLDAGFTTQPINLQNGTYGLLGGLDGYGGGNNGWYGDWAGYVGPSNLDEHAPKWNYGAQWDFALTKILSVPNNNLREMAWYVLMTNLHETGWHDDGMISGWQHHYSNHIRSANAHAEAARWADGLYASATGAYLADFEDDGADELVLYNDRLLAVFDKYGGKLQWLFCKGAGYNYSVVSNDNVYWVDTDGDYNETNHIAALSDVGVDGSNKQNDLYAFNVVTGAGGTVTAEIIHPDVKKTVSLTLGDPYLDVTYEPTNKTSRTYVKNGWVPDNLDLTWSGKSLERIWDPDGGGYFGQRNTNTQATAAIVVGSAGAAQNFQFSGTLLEGDEFNGVGRFQVLLYGGFTSPLDGMGHVPELKALRDGLTDTFGPQPCFGTYYPGSDHLTLFFDQEVAAASVVTTGFAIDDDNDGVAEVTLTGGEVLTTVGNSIKLDFDLTPATALALEALNPGTWELLLAASSVQDAVGNPNTTVTHTDDVPVNETPATQMQIDGLVNDGDWATPRKKIEDYWDSAWNSPSPGDTNEINVVYIDWDDTYLYLGLQGFVSGNSWILYLDTDVTGPDGETDLTAIDTWERGATFTGAGFAPDFHAGTFQHQGGSDSQTMWRLTSATTSVDITSQIVHAFDSAHLNGYEGGSEYAIPWDVLYGLGPGLVPPGTRIGVVASVCWDPDPAAELGGDVVPNNTAATLPVVDSFCEMLVDGDYDGLPDPQTVTGVPDSPRPAGNRILGAFPNPTRGGTRVPVSLGSEGVRGSYAVRAEVFDLRGRRVRVLADSALPAGEHVLDWDGRTDQGDDAGAGIFFVRVMVDGKTAGTAKLTRVVDR